MIWKGRMHPFAHDRNEALWEVEDTVLEILSAIPEA